MSKGVLITGTPGTGKTTIATELKKQDYIVVDVGKLVKEKQLYESYDEIRESYVIDDQLLVKELTHILEAHKSMKPVIFDGHVAELLPKDLLKCFVLRCSITSLRNRLEKRGYSETKIEENVEAEIMEVILTDMLFLYGPKKVSVIDTDKPLAENVKKIRNEIKKELTIDSN